MPSLFTPVALLGDLGGGELMLVLFAVLLLFGGDKMPQLAKGIGKSLREFKKAANEVEQEIKRAIDEVPDVPDPRATLREALEDKPKRLTPKPPAGTAAPGSSPASIPTTPADESPYEPKAAPPP